MTDDDAPGTVARPPAVLRVACILLVVLGFGSAAISLTPAFDAGSARCNLSRDRIKRANADKKTWNDVDTGGRTGKALPCADAVRLVSQIKLNEKGTRTDSTPSETAIRVQGFVGILLGFGLGISGATLARRMNRAARNAAVAFSAFGMVFPVLGPISFAVSVFEIYALMLSPPAKQRWGRDAS